MKKIILASASPRRQHLLKEVGLDFTIQVAEGVDEKSIADTLKLNAEIKQEWIAETIAKAKAQAVVATLNEPAIVISADTIVVLNDEIIGKPSDLTDAKLMLRKLSANKHKVVTGVCIIDTEAPSILHLFHDLTEVYFNRLTSLQIDTYVDNYKPLDKAGAYAIQEWIGLIGIEKINGDYYNVMGLPVAKVMQELERVGVVA